MLDIHKEIGELESELIHLRERFHQYPELACINMTGVLKIRTTKEFGESTVSKILDLVENSSSRKSKSENFISKFARYYTPAVCYSALALAIVPPLFSMLALASEPQWGVWVYRALTFLVISCPCV